MKRPVVVVRKSRRAAPPPLPPAPAGLTEAAPKGKPNPVGVAQLWLGGRMTECGDGYRLDGRLVGLRDLMRETNRLRAHSGLPQIDDNPAWRAP